MISYKTFLEILIIFNKSRDYLRILEFIIESVILRKICFKMLLIFIESILAPDRENKTLFSFELIEHLEKNQFIFISKKTSNVFLPINMMAINGKNFIYI